MEPTKGSKRERERERERKRARKKSERRFFHRKLRVFRGNSWPTMGRSESGDPWAFKSTKTHTASLPASSSFYLLFHFFISWYPAHPRMPRSLGTPPSVRNALSDPWVMRETRNINILYHPRVSRSQRAVLLELRIRSEMRPQPRSLSFEVVFRRRQRGNRRRDAELRGRKDDFSLLVIQFCQKLQPLHNMWRELYLIILFFLYIVTLIIYRFISVNYVYSLFYHIFVYVQIVPFDINVNNLGYEKYKLRNV